MNDDNADITCFFIFSAKIQKVDEYTPIFLVKFLFFAYFKFAFILSSNSIAHVASFSLKYLSTLSQLFLNLRTWIKAFSTPHIKMNVSKT